MKKQKFIAAGIAFALLLFALLAAPMLVPQTSLREWIAPQMQRALQQGVALDGPLSFSLLPRPRISARDLTLTRKNQVIAKVPQAEIALAFLPLLTGRVVPKAIRLLHPEIDFAQLFAKAAEKTATQSVGPGDSAEADHAQASITIPPAFPNLEIVQGTITLPGPDGKSWPVSALDAAWTLENEQGRLTGQAIWDGMNFRFEAGLVWRQAILQSSELALHLAEGVEIHWSGGADASGKLSVKLDHLAKLVPAIPDSAFSLSALVNVTPQAVDAKDLDIKWGDDDWRGKMSLQLGDLPHVEINLHSALVSLNRPDLVTSHPAAPASPSGPASPGLREIPAVKLPHGVQIDLALAIDQLLWRGKILQDVRLNLLGKDGDVTVNQANVTLPGNSELALYGRYAPASGFAGTFEAKSDDFREITNWVGWDLAEIPSDRLRVFRIAGDIKANTEEITIDHVGAKLDSSQIDLSATYRRGASPAFGINFAIDSLNGDAYFRRAKLETATPMIGNVAPKTAAPNPKPLALEANIKGRIGRANWRGIALQDMTFDTIYKGSSLKIDKFAINDVAGARLSLTGALTQTQGDWQFDQVKGDAESKDLGHTLHLLGLDAPLAVPARLSFALDGPLVGPHIKINAPVIDFGKAKINNVDADLSADANKVTLDHLTALLYGGQLSGDGMIGQNGDIALHLTLKGAEMRQALLDVADLGLAEGVLAGEVTLGSTGHAPSDMRGHLQGKANLQVTNGKIKGFDLKAADNKLAANEGLSGLLGLLQAGLNGGTTHFSNLTGSARIDQGIITSNDLRLIADGGGADAVVQVNLPANSIDAQANFHFATAHDAPPLSMRLNGSLEYPRRTLDIKPLQQWLAEHGLKTGKPKDVLKSLFPGVVK